MDSTIHRFKNARLAIFVGDHPPPHVHLLGPGFKASIEIESGEVKGHADRRLIAEAKAWMADNEAFLMQFWNKQSTRR